MDRIRQQFSSFLNHLSGGSSSSSSSSSRDDGGGGERTVNTPRRGLEIKTYASHTQPHASPLVTHGEAATASSQRPRVLLTDEAPNLLQVSGQLQMLRQRVRNQTRETTRPYPLYKPQPAVLAPMKRLDLARFPSAIQKQSASGTVQPRQPRATKQHRAMPRSLSRTGLVEKEKSSAFVSDAREPEHDGDENGEGDTQSNGSEAPGGDEQGGVGDPDSLYVAELRRHHTRTTTTVEETNLDDGSDAAGRDADDVAAAAAAAAEAGASESSRAREFKDSAEERKRGRSRRRTVTRDSDVTMESRKPRRDRSPSPHMHPNMRHMLETNETVRELFQFMETVAGSDRMIDRKTHRVKWLHVSELFDFSDPLHRLDSIQHELEPENYALFYQKYLTGQGRSIMKRAYAIAQESHNPYLEREPLLLWLLIKNVELSPVFLELVVWCLQRTQSAPALVSVSEYAVEEIQTSMAPAYTFFANVSMYFENVHGVERQVWRVRSPAQIDAAEAAEAEYRARQHREPVDDD